MSRYSSLDYLLKKAAALIQETIPHTTPPSEILFKENKFATDISSLGISENFSINNTSYDRYLHFLFGAGKFSIEAETNISYGTLTTEKWTNLITSLPTATSKAFLEIEDTYKSENDVQFDNETYPIADHLFESWWNIFDERYLKHGWPWTIALIMAYMSILVAGVIGNVMVILVVLLRPQMRTVTKMFITNLAVADLLVIVFCVPSTLLANIFSPWILGSFMCKAVAYVQGVSGCASAYSLAAISLDRCQAVYRNYERPRGFSQRICVKTVLIIWIVALSLTIPWSVIFEVKVSEYDGLRYCVETWEKEIHGNIYFLVVNLLCFYAIPLLLVFVSNWIIYCHVTNRHVPDNSIASAPLRKMHLDTKYHVLKMLGIVTLTFLFCWLPIYILVIIIKFSNNITESQYNVLGILMPIAQWLGSVNSGVNPILYAFLNKKFRQMCTSILPSWFPYKTTVKYVASNTTIGYTTHEYSMKSFTRSRANSRTGSHRLHHSGQKPVTNHANLLVTRLDEHTTTMAMNTEPTLPSVEPVTPAFYNGSPANNGRVYYERAIIEIITDV